MAVILKEALAKHMSMLASLSHANTKIDETKVYEDANLETRKFLPVLTDGNLEPGSCLKNPEQFKAFYNAVVNEGKSGVIMMDHYSNMDLPLFVKMLEDSKEEWAADFANRIVAIAGMKLNEENALIRALTESYTRVVIYPTRSLEKYLSKEGLSDEEKAAEEARARKINFAAMRAMDGCKKRGQIILVFPSGTRYRPGHPETKRGLRELDSYLRLFDLMLPVTINGNILRINPDCPNEMTMDLLGPDTVTYTAGEIVECKPFRKEILENIPEDCADPKQLTVDAVMKKIEDLHEKVEAERS